MTYRELAAFLRTLRDEQLDMDVAIKLTDDDFHRVQSAAVSDADDVLDQDHPYLVQQ